MTLNIGLRLDDIRGYSPQLKKTVYTPNIAWGPRIGITYITCVGSDTSVLKAFYGRLFEGTASDIYTSATPGIQNTTHTPLDAQGNVIGPPRRRNSGAGLRDLEQHQPSARRMSSTSPTSSG